MVVIYETSDTFKDEVGRFCYPHEYGENFQSGTHLNEKEKKPSVST